MRSPGAQDNVSVSQGMRAMFYMMEPSETAFQTVEEVPDYVKKVSLSWKRLFCFFITI
jgi:alkylglycerol monooxygenase